MRFLKSRPTGSRPFRWLMRANKPKTAGRKPDAAFSRAHRRRGNAAPAPKESQTIRRVTYTGSSPVPTSPVRKKRVCAGGWGQRTQTWVTRTAGQVIHLAGELSHPGEQLRNGHLETLGDDLQRSQAWFPFPSFQIRQEAAIHAQVNCQVRLRQSVF